MSSETRPRIVSRAAVGCSKISLSMKCLWPPFSAAIGSHSTRCVVFDDRTSVEVGELRRPSGVMTAISSSPRKTTSRVCAEDRRDVRGDEELVLAEADDDRRAVAHRDDLLGIVDRHEHEREHAAHQLQRAAHRVLEAVALHLALDEVRDDLGVGFGLELVALRLRARASARGSSR